MEKQHNFEYSKKCIENLLIISLKIPLKSCIRHGVKPYLGCVCLLLGAAVVRWIGFRPGEAMPGKSPTCPASLRPSA